MKVDEARAEAAADIRGARLLAGTALIIYIAALFLPLWVFFADYGFPAAHAGRWENAFPSDVGARLTIGFLIRDFTLPLIISVGLLVMNRGRATLAAGIFVGAGLFAILEGVARLFYTQFRARPTILMSIEVLVAALLLLAASRNISRKAPTVPPPPR